MYHSDAHVDISGAGNAPLLLRSKSLTSDELRHFRISLKWCALDHSSVAGKFISYSTFIFLAVIVPLVTSAAVKLPDAGASFNKLVHLPESSLAAIGFLTLARFFRRYGLRQLLFLDALHDDSQYVQRGYARELDKSFRTLACIILPAFFVELAHKIAFFSAVRVSVPYVAGGDFPANSVLFLLVMASWVYRTVVFLLVCVLFRLTCELQILRLQGLQKLFEGSGSGSDAGVIFGEHVRIRRQLWVTSHRYRTFIIGCLVVISVSQLGALLLVLSSKADKNFFNSGDVVVCSAVQLCGVFMCLLGAARITHRAQGIVSIATRWHMLATSSNSPDQTKPHSPEPDDSVESDSDSSNAFISVCPREPSSFETRQALVSYLQHNNGGITLFGFALDRGLLHTIFAFEFSLVLWILSKVVVLS